MLSPSGGGGGGGRGICGAFDLFFRVVYKSRQAAKFSGFSVRFRRLLSLFEESRRRGDDVYEV